MSIDVMGFLFAGTYTAVRVVEAMDNDSFLQFGAGLFVGGVLGYGAYLSSRDPPRPLFQLSTELLMTGVLGTRFKINRDTNDGVLLLVTAAAAIYSSCHYNKYLRQQLDVEEFLGLDTRRKVTIKIPDGIPDVQKAIKGYQPQHQEK